MIDWKYHVTTLASVFLALGIGIVIGSMLIGDQAVLGGQSSMLAQLEGDLGALRESNARFRREANDARRVVEEARAAAIRILPKMEDGCLKGTDVVLVTDGGPVPENLKQRLDGAGARVVSVMRVSPQGALQPQTASLLGLPPETTAAGLADRLGKQLGETAALGGKEDLISAGQSRGWITWDGDHAGGKAALVILVTPNRAAERNSTALFFSMARHWSQEWGPAVVSVPSNITGKPKENARLTYVSDLENPLAEADIIDALRTGSREE